ncbi:hypothetical protein HR12_15600 [Microbacterium sp. SUBG005]|nr:hypothetical protein HR12_15600 [Microbacterium sp. SUBG005]
MQTLQTTSLRVADNQLFILDQQALPQEKRWLDASTVEALVGHIHALRVRGAPLIGLSASLLLALLAEKGKTATSWRWRWKRCALPARRRST